MKTLLLIRHAKSSWDTPILADFDRPLNARGEADAPKMARRLKGRNLLPQVVISSPAERARQTSEIIASEVGYSSKRINFEPGLYHASLPDLLGHVNGIEPTVDIAYLVGHNPGLTSFANYLSDAGISNIPTCGICEIRFDLENWSLVSRNTGTLADFDYPKRH